MLGNLRRLPRLRHPSGPCQHPNCLVPLFCCAICLSPVLHRSHSHLDNSRPRPWIDSQRTPSQPNQSGYFVLGAGRSQARHVHHCRRRSGTQQKGMDRRLDRPRTANIPPSLVYAHQGCVDEGPARSRRYPLDFSPTQTPEADAS